MKTMDSIRSNQFKALSICLSLLCCLCIGASSPKSLVVDPVQDFRMLESSHDVNRGAILEIEADLNGDGVSDILLSHEKDINGRLGNMWVIYLRQGAEFVRSDSLVSFDPELAFTNVNGKATTLFTCEYAEDRELNVYKAEWKNEKLSLVPVWKIHVINQTDSNLLLERLRFGGGKLSVKKM